MYVCVVFPQSPDLDLSLLSRVLQGLEDMPGVSPLQLHAGHILPVPVLNQHRRLDGCGGTAEAASHDEVCSINNNMHPLILLPRGSLP